MKQIDSIALEGYGVRLEPLGRRHVDGLRTAVQDGALWKLCFTLVPAPDGVEAYIAEALDGLREGHMLPWVVRDSGTERSWAARAITTSCATWTASKSATRGTRAVGSVRRLIRPASCF